MTTHHSLQCRWLVLMLFLLSGSYAWAQVSSDSEIRVETELSRSSVFVGDELSYSIVVYGALNPRKPEVNFPEGVRAVFHGRSSQSFTSMRYENGQRRSVTQRSYIFQYTVTALSAGEFTIPAPTVEENQTTYTGTPSTFSSLLPAESDEDELVILLDRTQLYQNETIEVECVWWIGNNTSEFNFSSSALPESFEIRPLPADTNSQYEVDFVLNGQSMSGAISTVRRDGVERFRFSFRFTITPTEIGMYDLGPFRSIFTRQSGAGSRYRAFVESEATPIQVIPVPDEGKPAGYDGAIGAYSVDARASNNRVNVGDPIELTLRISGREPMTGLQDAPDLSSIPSFTEQFKVDSEGWRETRPRRDGVRTYTTTIRALTDRVSQIPPIEIPSFDPEQGDYRVYASDAIPLSVTSVREITLDDAIINPGSASTSAPSRPQVERIELTPAAPGLWAHGSIEEMQRDAGFDLPRTLSQPAWIVALASPPTLYLGLSVILAARRGRDENLVRLAKAYKEAKRAAGVESLRIYISQSMNIERDAVVASDAMLMQADPPLRDQAYQRLLDAERPGPDTPSIDCSTLLREIHASCLSHQKEAGS